MFTFTLKSLKREVSKINIKTKPFYLFRKAFLVFI